MNCNIVEHDRFGDGSDEICYDGRSELYRVNRKSLTALRYRDEILGPIVRPFLVLWMTMLPLCKTIPDLILLMWYRTTLNRNLSRILTGHPVHQIFPLVSWVMCVALVVSIPDFCPLSYFIAKNTCWTLFIGWFRVVLTHHEVFIGWFRHYEVFMN